MRPTRDRERLIRVARMYYQQDLSQQEIADALDTTRSNVSRILAAAREQGVVEIRIIEAIDRSDLLEEQLRRQLGIREARVLASVARQDVLADVGRLGAAWLREVAVSGRRVALSWGLTLQAVVQAVTPGVAGDTEVVQLVGGLSAISSKISGQELVRELSERLHCGYRYLHAPAVFASTAALRSMLAEPSISQAMDAARSADVAVVGLGAVGHGLSAEIVDALGLTHREQAELDECNPIGDICARYFDASGKEIQSVLHDRVLAIELDELRDIPTVAAVAVGASKGASIAAAARGELLDVLICDEAAARAALAAAGSARLTFGA